jgi:hypothetical protein
MIVRVAFALCVLASIGACESPVCNVEEIADKTPQEVVNILGEPDTAYTQVIVTKPIFTQIYKREFDIEIMYPDGLSTDIVVFDAAPKLPFEAGIIEKFGLQQIPPSDVVANTYIKWKNYPGYKTINFFVTDLDSAGNVEQFRLFFKSDGVPNKQ